jgi:LPXTG-motif cell wall-anchored protein
MKCARGRMRHWCAVLALLVAGGPAMAQPVASPSASAAARPLAAASGPGAQQFPDIPLRRDDADTGGGAQSVVTAALFLAVIAGAGLFLVRRRMPGAFAGKGPAWLTSPAASATPKVLGRTALTNQASVHTVEWGGEELLLGCTPQSVTVLARRPAQAGDTRSESKS